MAEQKAQQMPIFSMVGYAVRTVKSKGTRSVPYLTSK